MTIRTLSLTMGGAGATSVTQNGITFTFDAAYPVVQHLDGSYTVVAPSGLNVTGVSPGRTTVPAVTGTAQVGATMTCLPGTWAGAGATFTYQWFRAGAAITGATSSTHVLTVDDQSTSSPTVTRLIECRVTHVESGQTRVSNRFSFLTTPVVLPTPAGGTGRIVNGTMKNPVLGANYGFDERMSAAGGPTFNAALTLDFSSPVALVPGDVLVTGTHIDDLSSDTRDGLMSAFAMLHVSATAPGANTFSVPAAFWTGRSGVTPAAIDVGAFVDTLPSYNTTGQTVPSFETIRDSIAKFAPVAYLGDDFMTYQQFLPHAFGDPASGSENYGREVNVTVNPACLALISDGFTRDQKIEIATWVISHGIQWGEAVGNYPGGFAEDPGGHFQGFLGPIAVARAARGLGLSGLVATYGGNMRQAFQVSAADVAKLVPHSEPTWPHPWRRRTIPAGGVTGNVVTIPRVNSGALLNDQFGLFFTDMILTRESDGATAIVTTGWNRSSSTTMTVTIDAQPSPAFAPGDVVYFETPFPVTEGMYDWRLMSTSLSNWNPMALADYRSANKWTGQSLLLRACNWGDDTAAFHGYVQRANAANTPAGYDMPDHHRTTWESQFWAQHAATIYT